VSPQAIGRKDTVMFPQEFSQWIRRKVQRVSIPQEDLRAGFLHYLVGRLPESDRTRFEERLLQDQDFSDAAAACEQELIDAYALRHLNEEETRALGLWIEASPNRVERVAMARALLQATPRRGTGRQRWSFALAAAACLLVAGTLYLLNSRMHPAQKPALSAANAIPLQPIPPIPAQEAKTDVVLIAAERTRGHQKPSTYQIHRDSPIQLQILLPAETASSGYQVRVTDQTRTVLQQDNLEAQSVAGQLYLTVTLPPGSLPPATYTASVTRQADTLVSTFTLKWGNE
jgi:hypothetical protein